jgi:hypothetical protein
VPGGGAATAALVFAFRPQHASVSSFLSAQLNSVPETTLV